MSEATLEAAILRMVAERGPDKSICPSEVARAVAPGGEDSWRPMLSATRRAAIRLAAAGRLDILRKGRVVDPIEVRGVIRLRMRPPEETPT